MNKKIIWGVVIAVAVVTVGVYALKTTAFITCYSDWMPDNCYMDKFPYFYKNNKTHDNSAVSDWKTYVDPNQGYSFQYPKEFSLGEPNWSGSVRIFHKTPYDFNVFIRIDDTSKVDIPSKDDQVYSVGLLKGKFESTGSDVLGGTIYYFPIVGNRTLIITEHDLSDSMESEEILNKILSTFKFTSQPVSCVPEGGTYGAPLDKELFCCNGLVKYATSQSGTSGVCTKP